MTLQLAIEPERGWHVKSFEAQTGASPTIQKCRLRSANIEQIRQQAAKEKQARADRDTQSKAEYNTRRGLRPFSYAESLRCASALESGTFSTMYAQAVAEDPSFRTVSNSPPNSS